VQGQIKFHLMPGVQFANFSPKLDFFFLVQESDTFVIFVPTFYQPNWIGTKLSVANSQGECEAQERSIAVCGGRLVAPLQLTHSILVRSPRGSNRIIGGGDLWITEFILTYDGKPS
jgi:hypothetical protein